jgi:hypothetical protein
MAFSLRPVQDGDRVLVASIRPKGYMPFTFRDDKEAEAFIHHVFNPPLDVKGVKKVKSMLSKSMPPRRGTNDIPRTRQTAS